jgi:ankyrin repeat protein
MIPSDSPLAIIKSRLLDDFKKYGRMGNHKISVLQDHIVFDNDEISPSEFAELVTLIFKQSKQSEEDLQNIAYILNVSSNLEIIGLCSSIKDAIHSIQLINEIEEFQDRIDKRLKLDPSLPPQKRFNHEELQNMKRQEISDVYTIKKEESKKLIALLDDRLKHNRRVLIPDLMLDLLDDTSPSLDFSPRYKEYYNVLHLAAFSNDPSLVDMAYSRLGKYTSTLFQQYGKGDSPLHLAFIKNNIEVFNRMIEKGADINHLNQDGLDLWSLAIKHNSLDLLKTCESFKNLKPPRNDFMGNNPLHIAYQNKVSDDVLDYLKAHPSYETWINEKNIYGKTPAQPLTTPSIAQKIVLASMENYLIQKGRDPSILPRGGHCHGFSFLFGFYASIGRRKEYFDILRALSGWDGTPESLLKETPFLKEYETKPGESKYLTLGQLFEQLINDVVWQQHNFAILFKITQLQQKDRQILFDYLKSNKVHLHSNITPIEVSPPFNDLDKVLQLLQTRPQSVIEFWGGQHSTSAYIDENKQFWYYDPNFGDELPPLTRDITSFIINTKMIANNVPRWEIEIVSFKLSSEQGPEFDQALSQNILSSTNVKKFNESFS